MGCAKATAVKDCKAILFADIYHKAKHLKGHYLEAASMADARRFGKETAIKVLEQCAFEYYNTYLKKRQLIFRKPMVFGDGLWYTVGKNH